LEPAVTRVRLVSSGDRIVMFSWRKLLWGAFWVLCTAILLLKVLVLSRKGLLLLGHLWEWLPQTLALALITVIAIGVFRWCSRKLRQPASS
jgi:hypothetical protein